MVCVIVLVWTMEPSIENALALTPEEARTYASILGATSTLPKSDPRYALVIGVTWWLLHRRRRMEQQLIRRRHFSRRLRRLMYLRWQLQRNTLQGLTVAYANTEAANTEDLGCVPDKRLWVKKDSTTGGDEFWTQFDQGLLTPEVFMRSFHMSQETFNFIYAELAEHLRKSNTTMREPLPAKKRLAATLYRLATNAEYLKVASLFGIGKSTTTSLVRDVCDVIVNILKDKYLSLTTDESDENAFGIPGAVGVLGAIDVFIVGSTWDWSENSPFSSIYSQSYALIFQAVVDQIGHFRHVSASCPAGSTNLEALHKSSLLVEMQERMENGLQLVIAADESYELPSENKDQQLPSLVTPHKEEDTKEKRDLNQKLRSARTTFEESVFKVKSRWKIFHGKNGKINFNADAFENIAMACCILHNICEARKDSIDPSWSADVHDSLFLRCGEPSSTSTEGTNKLFLIQEDEQEDNGMMDDDDMIVMDAEGDENEVMILDEQADTV